MRRQSPLVGREAELEALERALRDAAGGFASVLLAGEPGIGKTRLLSELCARAEARRFLVLSGRAAELERDLPFAPVVDALDDYLGSLDERFLAALGEGHRQELARVFPALSRPGLVPAVEGERYRAHFAVRALVERLAGPRPLVLALDDLHWADAASAELLSYLVRRPPAAPVLLALSFRPAQAPGALAAALARAERDGALVRVDLPPLPAAEADRLLGSELDAGTRAELYAESGGNPFYLEQLARAAATRARRRPASAAPELQRTPPAVTAAIAEELVELAPATRALLQAAAVTGDPFALDLAAETAELSERSALELLDRLLALDLVRATDTPRSFAFRHPIVRRAVYESATPGWRIAAHRRAASALRARGAPAPALAHHVEQSASPGDEAAVGLLVEAGETAGPRAPAAAARWYAAALRLLPAAERDAGRGLELRLREARALASAGRIEESRDALRALLASSPPELEPVRTDVATLCGGMEWLLRRHAEARDLLLETLRALPEDGSPDATRLKLELANVCVASGDHRLAADWSRQAYEGARAQDDAMLQAAAAVLLGITRLLVGEFPSGLELMAEGAALVDRLPDEEVARRLDALSWLAWNEVMLERFDEGIGHAQRGLDVAHATGQSHVLAHLLIGLASASAIHGALGLAAERFDEAIEASLLTGSDELHAWALGARAWTATWAGDVAAAVSFGEQAVEVSRGWDDLVAAVTSCYLAEALVEAGDAERARALVLASAGGPELPRLAPIWRPRWYELLARAELALERAGEAAGWAAAAAQAAEGVPFAWASGWALAARGHVLLAGGDAQGAARVRLEAAEEFQARGMLAPASSLRLLAGQALAAAGDPESAAAELERAHAELREMGANRLRDEAARELRRLGRRVARAGERGDGGGLRVLSKRELEIAELVAAGRTNREIAAALYLSEKTVESHLRRVFRKLDVTSRAAVAAAVAREAATA